MTGEEMERAFQFLIEHQAKVSTAQDRTTANIAALTRTVVELAESVSRLEAQAEIDRREMRERFEIVSRLEAQAEIDRREMRERFEIVTEEMHDGFNRMILGNEVTRDLTNQIARLAIETSQRVTVVEGKLTQA
jgi:hypothetical protein